MVEDENASEARLAMPKEIQDALFGAGVQRWPYVRFRTASEQRAL
jgi:hypothetical protein